jgi:hypothetical protein
MGNVTVAHRVPLDSCKAIPEASRRFRERAILSETSRKDFVSN